MISNPTSGYQDSAVTPQEAHRIGEILEGGVMWDALRVREGGDDDAAANIPASQPVDPTEINRQTEALLDLLCERQIDCVLVGAVAMLQYVAGRNTRDIDFIISKSELRRCPEIVIHSEDKTFSRGTFHGVQVDFLYTSHAIFKLVAEQFSHSMQLGKRTVRVAMPEALVIMKLYAIPDLLFQMREDKVWKYEEDVREILNAFPITDDFILGHLKRFRKPGEFLAIKTILGEIRERIKRRQDFLKLYSEANQQQTEEGAE